MTVANPQVVNVTHMGDHIPPMTPLTSGIQAGLPISSPARGAPPSPNCASAWFKRFLVFAGIGVKLDEVFQLLVMHDLDDYTVDLPTIFQRPLCELS